MADSLIIKTSKLSEVYDLAPRLREDDIKEIEATGQTVEASLLNGFKTSTECLSVFEATTGNIVGMFGYTLINHIAGIWFLGTDEMEKYPFAFIRKGKQFINKLIDKGYTLVCCAYSKNTTHLKYIKSLGLVEQAKHTFNDNEFITYIK